MCMVMTMYSILDNLEKYKKTLLFGLLGRHKKPATTQTPVGSKMQVGAGRSGLEKGTKEKNELVFM